ncbi:hypothetical protein [Aquabacterium humicola]|uniref:DUF7931 domain-containing protein n=1 Tax=Aquabacterium humicola TaxID=3237377 RepID=UPI00254271F0|nr:hypothetical protein [Rubrivivax pictus]
MTDARDDRLEGRDACISALREQLLALPSAAPRLVWCIDPDFVDWPFEEPAVMQALTRWAQAPGRQIRFMALDYDQLMRRHPRLAAWRRDWSHCIQAWRPADSERAELPSWLLAGGQAIEWLDREHWRGRRLQAPPELRQLEEACDALAQRCEPAWPATVLGL